MDIASSFQSAIMFGLGGGCMYHISYLSCLLRSGAKVGSS